MKVGVTGATGFVGRQVLARLSAEGHEAVALVRRPAGLANEIVVGDLADAAIDPAALSGIEAIIHLAARTHVLNDPAADPMAAYRAANVAGTNALLDAALAAGSVRRFVFMSSIKAMGERTAPGHPFTPDTPPVPEDGYGISKLEAEQEVQRRCAGAGVAWTILRPPLVYGPGAKGNFHRLVSLVARGLPLPLGTVDNRRSMVYVGNLAEAAIRACVAPGAMDRVLLIADTTLSTPDLLRAIARALGKRARLFAFPPAMLHLAGRVTGTRALVDRLCGSLELDTRSSFAALDWQPSVSLDAAIGETVAAQTTPAG